MQIDVYNQKGEKKSKTTLPKELFEVKIDEGLIHLALKRQLANARTPVAHTKTKGEIRGGGRKPHRQKGTGRARQGSIRSPHMKGGGVTFGPRNVRNFEIQLPKKQRRKALAMALSAKAKDKKVFGLDKYEDKDAKTKNFSEMLKKLPIERNVLVITPGKDETVKRASANIPEVKTIQVNYVNIQDLTKYDSLCFVGESLAKAKEIFKTK